MAHDFGNGATVERDDGRSARKSLDHHDAKRLVPFDRHQERRRGSQQRILLAIIDFAEIDDVIAVHVRSDFAFEVRDAVPMIDTIAGDYETAVRISRDRD